MMVLPTHQGVIMDRNKRIGLIFTFVVSAILWFALGYGLAQIVS